MAARQSRPFRALSRRSIRKIALRVKEAVERYPGAPQQEAPQPKYFFHDVTSYTKQLTQKVPNLDPVTLLYVQEVLQAFGSGCILSSLVMLGVATEHTFLLLLEQPSQVATAIARL